MLGCRVVQRGRLPGPLGPVPALGPMPARAARPPARSATTPRRVGDCLGWTADGRLLVFFARAQARGVPNPRRHGIKRSLRMPGPRVLLEAFSSAVWGFPSANRMRGWNVGEGQRTVPPRDGMAQRCSIVLPRTLYRSGLQITEGWFGVSKVSLECDLHVDEARAINQIWVGNYVAIASK